MVFRMPYSLCTLYSCTSMMEEMRRGMEAFMVMKNTLNSSWTGMLSSWMRIVVPGKYLCTSNGLQFRRSIGFSMRMTMSEPVYI